MCATDREQEYPTSPSLQIDLKVIKYDARGKFLGWEDVRGETLQCTVEVSDLLRRVPEPIFYELFLQFEDEKGDTRLWQVPVNNPAIRTNGQASSNPQMLRRLFLVDGLSGRKYNLTNTPASVTLAAELLLRLPAAVASAGVNEYQVWCCWDIDKAETNSSCFTCLSAQIDVSFSVSYIQSPGTAQQATDIAFGVLGFLALLSAFLETGTWVRRSRLPNVNFMIILKFFAFFAGSLANVFFVVTLGIGIYWLIVFKGQQVSAVEMMLPAAGSQIETNFIVYLLCAFVLKSVNIIHILITQTTVSIFLIDWEKPKARQTVQASTGNQGAASSVSAWRTFLIANEWNEIQTHRKVSPSLQLFAVLLLLEVVGLKNLASRDLNVNLNPDPNDYQAPWSPILRFGIAASVWLAVWIVQVVFSVGFYERFVEDKIHQFVDLCSLSNVSVFILTHRCYGFYIHGRSVHGHADVDMDTIHSYFRKEEENLCPLRGLEANSEVQTFEVLLTDKTRTLYDRITQSSMEVCFLIIFCYPLQYAPKFHPGFIHGLKNNFLAILCQVTKILKSLNFIFRLWQVPRGKHVRSDLHSQRLKGYHALNRFLISFLEHRYKDLDYVVKDKYLMERILDMEFQEPGDINILYNDDRSLFSRTLFYNHELTLVLFDILLFSAVDLGAQDFVLATVVTFVAQKLLQMLRDALGRRNLAEKTLVEKQFLI
ncbi:meckelin-like [Sceloporus undulatus]|uniref:meckelin-like n=1 Tax=Sceloporus undulatus TaxID=8520 RepID=UPI001C4B54C0|nr:meckelin-like [Sceloporus undulatus]